MDGDRAPCRSTSTPAACGPASRSRSSGRPLTAELGPGLLGGVFDGMLRRLDGAERLRSSPARAARDAAARPAAGRSRPRAAAGDEVGAGAAARTRPRDAGDRAPRARPARRAPGRLEWLADAGEYARRRPIARVGGTSSRSRSAGRCGSPRPFARAAPAATAPLVTGPARPRPPLPGRARQHRRGPRRLRHRARPCCCSRSPSGATPT